MRKLLVLLTVLFAVPALAAEPPEVVATIKPVHALVAGVMAGVGAPHLLVKGAASPHTYQMRPSDARMLARAAVVFRVGEALEAFLDRPLATLAAEARVVELAEAPGVTRLGLREGGVWDEHEHEHEAGHDDQHHGHEGEHDMHVWLDPRNARAMVAAIAAALAEADPANARAYRANAASLTAELERLDEELAAALAPVRGKPYIVFHDAYQYLEARYGLAPAGAITIGPEVAPGARRVAEIRRRIKQAGVACVFAEPQFEPKLARLAVEGSGARIATLDPLGAALADGPGLYGELMRRLAGGLRACLLPQG